MPVRSPSRVKVGGVSDEEHVNIRPTTPVFCEPELQSLSVEFGWFVESDICLM